MAGLSIKSRCCCGCSPRELCTAPELSACVRILITLVSHRVGSRIRIPERFFRSSNSSACAALLQDLRFGWRILARNPGSTAVMIVTLALALGVITAIFSVLNSALLQMLPVRNSQDLVILTDPNASMVLGGMLTGERSLLTYPEFSQLRDRVTTMSGICASQLTLDRWTVRITGFEAEQVRGRLVSENYFSTLGVRSAIGRFFTQEDATAAGKDPYAVISYDYWQRRFLGSRAAIGTTIRLKHATLTIIGVAAKGFHGETVGQEPDLWVPMLMQPLIMPSFDGLRDTLGASQDKLMWLHVFGRRKPGVSMARVQAEVSVLFRGILQASYPAAMAPQTRREALNQYIRVKALGSGAFHGRNEFAEQWTVLLALAALVLLVACANVANLLLARAALRSREVAIRLSIGAGTGRLARQFLTESLLLAILGGVGGILVAEFASRVLGRLLSLANELTLAVGLDVRVLGFIAGVTVLTGILFGLAPALRTRRGAVNESLKETGRGGWGSRKQSRLAKLLVVAQLALSLLLIVGAGLFARTLWNLESVDLGYPQKDLLLVQVDSSNAGYSGSRATTLYHQIAARIQQIPGVRAVTYSDRGLFSGFEGAFAVHVEGFASRKEEDRGSTGDSVGPRYFTTIGIPMILGREIGAQDMAGVPRVCVINEAFARHFFAGRNPIGLHVTTMQLRLEVVGVAKNVRVQSLRGRIDPKFYVPGGGSWFEVRTISDPNRLLSAVHRVILGLDDGLTLESTQTLNQTVALQNAQPRLVAQLSSGFGILALLVAGIGVYGLVSYSVANRTNEIGVRMALGADKGRVIGMVLKETGFMIAMGICVGLASTAAAVRLIATQLYGPDTAVPRWSLAQYEHVQNAVQLYGVGALDPLTIGVTIIILCGLTLTAAAIPATRAARVDPSRALHHE